MGIEDNYTYTSDPENPPGTGKNGNGGGKGHEIIIDEEGKVIEISQEGSLTDFREAPIDNSEPLPPAN